MKENKFSLVVDYLVYLIASFFIFIITHIPESWAYSFGAVLGRLAFVAVRDRRDAVIENLTFAFGSEKDEKWILNTARKSFEHLGLLIVEFFISRRWSIYELRRRLVIEGRDNYNLMFLPGPHGICLLNSHFGCFEVTAATVKYLGFNLHLIATGLKNKFLNRYVWTRGDFGGIHTYPHRGSAKLLTELMREGALVACLADQRGDVERGIIVDYFGTPAPANEIFAKMAIEGKARIQPCCTYRTGPGKYKTIFGKEITYEITADRKTDLINLSQSFHNQFEAWLRMCPEQGFWFQRKWRRAPSRKRSGVRSWIRKLKKSSR